LERLKKYQLEECLLEDSSFSSIVTGDLADLDGTYGVADGGRRFLMMQFGAAKLGMSNGWRGHEKASKIESAHDRKIRFYTCYPHHYFLHNDPSRLQKCLFQDLQQFVGIGFKRETTKKT
jgi:hypothetical protein